MFQIPGRDGLYYEKTNWIDKFFRKGKALEELCPLQLVKMYDYVTQGKVEDSAYVIEDGHGDDDDDAEFSETVKKYGKEAKFHHIIKSNGKPGKKLP